MNYTEQQFFSLIEEIEAQGGELTEELCGYRQYDFSGDKGKPVALPGCGNTSIFNIPYDADRGDGVLDMVKLCAVCDDLGSAPRFAHAI